jgi:antitoxin YefM
VVRVPLDEAADRSSQLIGMVEQTHETVTITRHAREAAVLMAEEDLDSLHETLFWLSQPGVREDVEAARAEVEGEGTTSGDELRAEFGLGE